MVVKFELKVNNFGNGEDFRLHRGTIVLPDETTDTKVLRAVRKTLKMSKGCCQLEKTTNGWSVQPAKMMAVGSITVAF